MLALIETDLGKISLDLCFAAYMGALESNQGYEIKEVSKAGLRIALMANTNKSILPVGSVDFIKSAAEILGVQLPEPLNIPESLLPYVGRKIWQARKSEVHNFPCFIKPLTEVKLFTGFVANSPDDLNRYAELKDWDGLLFCSEPLPPIISEWRCYILRGEVLACSFYGSGDPMSFPDKSEIYKLISHYQHAPSGYSLDVAVTTSGTHLIECNDGWALGYYGGSFVNYFNLVKTRWEELVELSEYQTD